MFGGKFIFVLKMALKIKVEIIWLKIFGEPDLITVNNNRKHLSGGILSNALLY